MRKILILPIFLWIGITISACSMTNETTTVDNEELIISTSLYPIEFIVERIGGETVIINSIFPPGVDAHTYEPTSKDMTEIARSDAFIYLGAGMEGFSESIADALASQDVELIEIGSNEELFQASHHHDHEHDDHSHGDYDPHIWLDPVRMIDIATIISEHLTELNPTDESLYKENFQTLKNDLKKLDEKFVSTLSNKDNKQILVSHAAFGYWEERYGMEQIAINGLSSSSEPSQKELTNIIEEANNNELDYIIFEQNTTNRVSEIVQENIGVEAVTIHNLAVLTEEDIQDNEDYISLMENNLQVLDKITK